MRGDDVVPRPAYGAVAAGNKQGLARTVLPCARAGDPPAGGREQSCSRSQSPASSIVAGSSIAPVFAAQDMYDKAAGVAAQAGAAAQQAGGTAEDMEAEDLTDFDGRCYWCL